MISIKFFKNTDSYFVFYDEKYISCLILNEPCFITKINLAHFLFEDFNFFNPNKPYPLTKDPANSRLSGFEFKIKNRIKTTDLEAIFKQYSTRHKKNTKTDDMPKYTHNRSSFRK